MTRPPCRIICIALALLLLAGTTAARADEGASQALSVFGTLRWGMEPEQVLKAFPTHRFDKPVEGNGFITLSYADTYDEEPVQVTFTVMTAGQGLIQCDIHFLKDSPAHAARFDAYAKAIRERLGREEIAHNDTGGTMVEWRDTKSVLQLWLGARGALALYARSTAAAVPGTAGRTP